MSFVGDGYKFPFTSSKVEYRINGIMFGNTKNGVVCFVAD